MPMRKWSWVLLGLVNTGALIAAVVYIIATEKFSGERLRVDGPDEQLEARSGKLRAFYSGHSLSDGVPEGVAEIATSFGGSLEFDVQSFSGSTIAQRLLDQNLDRLRLPGATYDAFVITERHDLPYVLLHDDTVWSFFKLYLRVHLHSP